MSMVQVSRDRQVETMADGVQIEVRRGIMSRTGKAFGNVDEGLCVEVVVHQGEIILSRERLYAPDRYDPTARNKGGTLGAFCDQMPAQNEIDAAVQRARDLVALGTFPEYRGPTIRRVAAA